MATETAPAGGPESASAYFLRCAESGNLQLPHCGSCGRAHWYPRRTCPFCGGGAIELRPSSGRAVLHSFSPSTRADPPYILAYVELAEGPMMMTNIVGCDPAELRIGQALSLAFAAGESATLPVYRPAEEAGRD